MKALIAAAVFLFSATAAAEDVSFYAGAHLGQSKFESTCDGVTGAGISCDNKGQAWKVLGGARLHPNLAAELSYADFGEAKATGPSGDVTAKANAFDLSGVASFSPLDRLAVYGRLGFYRAKTEVRANTVTLNRTESETNTGFTYGFGVSYEAFKRWTVRAEWQKYPDVGGGNVGEDDITVMSLGVLFKF